MSSGKRGFWGFFRRKEKRDRPFLEFLERERMPETSEKAESLSPETDGQASLDELFVDWDSGRILEEDLRRASRWDGQVAPEESEEAEPPRPPETAEYPDLLIEFPPLLEEEELAQLVGGRDMGGAEKRPGSPAEGEPVMPAEVKPVTPVEQDRGGHLEVEETSAEEREEGKEPVSGPRPGESGPILGESSEEQAVPEEVVAAAEELGEIYQLLAALEVRVAERLVDARSGG